MQILKNEFFLVACTMMSLKLQGFNGTKGEKGNQGIPGTVFGKTTQHSKCNDIKNNKLRHFDDPQRLKACQA